MSQERSSSTQPEVQPPLSLEELPAGFGFIETDELRGIRIAAARLKESGDPEVIEKTIEECIDAGQNLVDSIKKKSIEDEIIGLELAIGLVNRDAGRFLQYRGRLRDTRVMARGAMDTRIKDHQSYDIYRAAIVTLTHFIDEAAEKYGLPELESRFNQPPLPD